MDGFEAHCSHLRSVAYPMLGSLSEANDAVQEVATTCPHEGERYSQHTSLAYHRGSTGVPGHVALAQGAA